MLPAPGYDRPMVARSVPARILLNRAAIAAIGRFSGEKWVATQHASQIASKNAAVLQLGLSCGNTLFR
jgi:hypothetical protein